MITGVYATLIAAIYIALSGRIILFRRANAIGLGDDGNKSLMKRMRAQANCGEYAPFGVVLMLLVELQAPSATLLHLIGALLLAGRLSHAYGFSASPPKMILRQCGMMLTLASYLGSMASLLFFAIGPF